MPGYNTVTLNCCDRYHRAVLILIITHCISIWQSDLGQRYFGVFFSINSSLTNQNYSLHFAMQQLNQFIKLKHIQLIQKI